MAVEHAPPGRKGFYGAFPQMGAPAGDRNATIAFFLVSQLPDVQFLAWGWRIPFLFSAVLIVLGRPDHPLTFAESPEFAAMIATSGRGAHAHRRCRSGKHPREILLVAGNLPLARGPRVHLRGLPGLLRDRGAKIGGRACSSASSSPLWSR